jgi:hypothetical protein
MTKFKGTEGKWIARPQVISSHGFYIEKVDKSFNNSFIGEVGGGLQSINEIKANAILISKAPEMLEMLKNILLILETPNAVINILPIKNLIKEATND